MTDIVEIPVEFVSATEMKRLREIETAAKNVVQSLRDDGWDETVEGDRPELRRELCELMALLPRERQHD